jgi:hypothetical protein
VKRVENEGHFREAAALATPLPGTSFSRLKRELEQCKHDILNLPFPPIENRSQTLYPF